jgi:hypothetical protein
VASRLAIGLSKKDVLQAKPSSWPPAGGPATIFGSPVVGAVIIIEAAGLGGPTLPLILLPGLIAAGMGSLVFVGMGSLTGLSTGAYAISPLALPAYSEPTLGAFAWTIAIAAVAAVVTFLIIEVGRKTEVFVTKRRVAFSVLTSLAIGVLAIRVLPDHRAERARPAVLGQEAMNPVVSGPEPHAGVLRPARARRRLGDLAGSAREARRSRRSSSASWVACSLRIFRVRGGAGGRVLVGAAVVSVLRLPLSAVVIALLVTFQAEAAVHPARHRRGGCRVHRYPTALTRGALRRSPRRTSAAATTASRTCRRSAAGRT